jgi:hypothetical protein
MAKEGLALPGMTPFFNRQMEINKQHYTISGDFARCF